MVVWENPQSNLCFTVGDRLVRECNVTVARSTGFIRWVNLKFADFFWWAGSLGREIQRDVQCGKDDNYHDEY